MYRKICYFSCSETNRLSRYIKHFLFKYLIAVYYRFILKKCCIFLPFGMQKLIKIKKCNAIILIAATTKNPHTQKTFATQLTCIEAAPLLRIDLPNAADNFGDNFCQQCLVRQCRLWCTAPAPAPIDVWAHPRAENCISLIRWAPEHEPSRT